MYRYLLPGFTLLALMTLTLTGCKKDSERHLSTPTMPSINEDHPDLTPTQIFAQLESTAVQPLVPTFTLIPTVTPRAIPSVTPDTTVKLMMADDFGTDRNPLTGEIVEDPELLMRRPIAIKISNAPAKYTRPQSGLSQADLVFEHVTEGTITRFTAIIYSQTPAKMGPIRSARLIDLEIPAMYDAALAFSGSSIGVSRKLFSSDFASRILRSNQPGYYRTGEAKPYEHTLYARPEEFWPALGARDENRKPNFSTVQAFSSDPEI